MGAEKTSQCRLLAVSCVSGGALCPLAIWFFPTLLVTVTTGVVTVASIFIGGVAWRISQHSPADSHSLYSLIVQYIITSFLVVIGERVHTTFHTNSKCVKETQDQTLLSILKRNQKCKYFVENKLQHIENAEDYMRSQPLTNYWHYSQYISDIESGKQNILTVDPVVFMALTSGTTGKNKHIPITAHMKGPAAKKVGPLMYYCMHKKAGLTLERVMVLSYKSTVKETSSGLLVGPVSAHMCRYVPFVVAPRESYDICEEQSALHVHAVFGFSEVEVGHMEALMSTLVYAFWKYVEHNWKSICSDIETGTINSNLSMDQDLNEILSKNLKPNPTRAAQLRSYFSEGCYGIAKKIWPRMRFVRTLTTGGFALHAQVVANHYMPDIKMLSLAHVASEGFMGFNISPDPDTQLYTAIVDYGFLEFIPVADVTQEQPATRRLHELEREAEYEIVMTSPMGLYRYRTGDVIKVVDFLNQTPVYQFQYRMGQVLNLYWEKTHESALFMAVQQSVASLCSGGRKLKLVDFTATEDICMPAGYRQTVDVGPGNDVKKHYVLFVELEGENGERVNLDFTEKLVFDRSLCAISELYRMIRESGSAGAMVVVPLVPGAFLQLKAHLIESTQTQQFKVPRVMRRQDSLRVLLLHRCRTDDRAKKLVAPLHDRTSTKDV